MEQQGFHRKLTAILSADIASYSRLLQDEEDPTVKTLESLTDPGDICISKKAFDQIETKLPLGYEYLGNSFFIRLLGELPKKEIYLCPKRRRFIYAQAHRST